MRRLGLALVCLAMAPVVAEGGVLTYAGTFNPLRLHEELLVAFPGQSIRVESKSDGSMVRIEVPDAIPSVAVDAVVAAHNPATPSGAEVVAQKIAEARADLKAQQPGDLAQVLSQVDAAFPDPAQRAIVRRLVRAAYYLVRERRADE